MEVTILQARGFDANSVVSIRAGRTRRQALVTHKRPFRFPSLSLNASPMQIDVMAPLASSQLDAISAAETHSVLFPTEPGQKTMSMTLQVRDVPRMCSSPSNVLQQMSSMSRAGAMSACSDLTTRATSATGYASSPTITRDCPSSASVPPRDCSSALAMATRDCQSVLGSHDDPAMMATRNCHSAMALHDCPSALDGGSAVIAARNYLEKSNVLGFMQELLRYVVREMPEDPISFMASHLAAQHNNCIIPEALGPASIDGFGLAAEKQFAESSGKQGESKSRSDPSQPSQSAPKVQDPDLGKWLEEENSRLRSEILRLEDVCQSEGLTSVECQLPPPSGVGVADFEGLKAEHVQMNNILITLCEDVVSFASKLHHQDASLLPEPCLPVKKPHKQRIQSNRGMHDGAGDDSESEMEEAPTIFVRPRAMAVSAEAVGQYYNRQSISDVKRCMKSSEECEVIRAALKASPIFANLDDDGLDPIIDSMVLHTYEAAQVMVRQGDIGDEMLVVLDGVVGCYSDVGARKILVQNIGAGRTVGELSMLWRTPRALSVVAKEKCTCGKLSRKVYQDYVVRREVNAFDRRVRCLRNTTFLEGLSDEQIAGLADVAECYWYEPGEVIIYQGDVGTSFFIVLSGECVAMLASGDIEHQDIQEHRRYYAGDFFGERALHMENPTRAASISTISRSEVMCLSRCRFERLIGTFNQLRTQSYLDDPRASIAAFYKPGNELGPAGAGGDPNKGGNRTDWFAVYRPTSREAIAKMLGGRAVGKGLNVKGKSAKWNRLAGFVPFLQISENRHKEKIECSPNDTFFDMYWQSDLARRHCQKALQALLDEADDNSPIAEILSPALVELNQYTPDVYGFRIPEALIHKAFIEDPEICFPVGWETGRKSEPAFMDMNLHVLRNDRTRPRVVLYQANLDNPMSPHGLLMAYAEGSVKPCVSDFDTFLVGSRGMTYEPLPPDQIELAQWMLERTAGIMSKRDMHSWTTRWLEVMKNAVQEGRTWEVPTNGFGDATSIQLIEKAMEATRESGAVRHGAECFNFAFPQELDMEYLVVWDGFETMEGKAWDYLDEDELRAFLIERVNSGYAFPLNPVWLIRDMGWYDVLQHLQANQETASVIPSWYPPGSGLLEKIQEIHDAHPRGFVQDEREGGGGLKRSQTFFHDLDGNEKADLALDQIRRHALMQKFRHATKALTGLGVARRMSKAIKDNNKSPEAAAAAAAYMRSSIAEEPDEDSEPCKLEEVTGESFRIE